MLQIFALEQVGNSSSISLSYNWAHSENPIAIILLSSNRWISGCYVTNNLCRISCNRIFRHFYSLSEKWVCGFAGVALFCVSSKVWFILPNPIWCHRGKPPSAPSNKLVDTNILANIHMYTVDLNPQSFAIGPISPNFTKTNRNSDGNNLLNELYCWKMTKDSTKGELIEWMTD
jgi:hypothetical protein